MHSRSRGESPSHPFSTSLIYVKQELIGGGGVQSNMEERDDGKARLRKTVTTSRGKRRERHFPSWLQFSESSHS